MEQLHRGARELSQGGQEVKHRMQAASEGGLGKVEGKRLSTHPRPIPTCLRKSWLKSETCNCYFSLGKTIEGGKGHLSGNSKGSIT